MTTNGLLLERYSVALAGAGLERINVGFDSLRPGRFHAITRGGELRGVLRGIDAVRSAGIGGIKINVVVMRGVNDDEMEDFQDWARSEGLAIRFIEFMPVYGEDMFVSLKPRIESFRKRKDVRPIVEDGGGPARSFRYGENGSTVGFILPRSEQFCDQCNRLRLTADGKLLPCLFSQEGIDIKAALRSASDIAGLIRMAAGRKPACYDLGMELKNYGMYALGG
jgi:cyclic pyranopterin phosphate synthase